jgi:hypothetical protein
MPLAGVCHSLSTDKQGSEAAYYAHGGKAADHSEHESKIPDLKKRFEDVVYGGLPNMKMRLEQVVCFPCRRQQKGPLVQKSEKKDDKTNLNQHDNHLTCIMTYPQSHPQPETDGKQACENSGGRVRMLPNGDYADKNYGQKDGDFNNPGLNERFLKILGCARGRPSEKTSKKQAGAYGNEHMTQQRKHERQLTGQDHNNGTKDKQEDGGNQDLHLIGDQLA